MADNDEKDRNNRIVKIIRANENFIGLYIILIIVGIIVSIFFLPQWIDSIEGERDIQITYRIGTNEQSNKIETENGYNINITVIIKNPSKDAIDLEYFTIKLGRTKSYSKVIVESSDLGLNYGIILSGSKSEFNVRIFHKDYYEEVLIIERNGIILDMEKIDFNK